MTSFIEFMISVCSLMLYDIETSALPSLRWQLRDLERLDAILRLGPGDSSCEIFRRVYEVRRFC